MLYHAILCRMIRYWKYDDGSPIWSPILGDYIGKPSKPRWHCMVSGRSLIADEIGRWLESNLDDDDYDAVHRFNSGDPSLFIDIYDRDAATLFRMAWIEDNG